MKKNNIIYEITAIIFILSFVYVPVYGKGQRQTEQKQSPSSVVIPSISATPLPTVYWTGDGGKGIRLAVLEPTGKGLSTGEQWILSMIQSSMTGDFQKFSAMTIIDRQNLEKILKEQNQSMSGNYSDKDYISIGKLTNARYILAGSITKTSSTFMMEFAVTDAESGERKASYPPKAISPLELENLSAIKEVTTELLLRLGVQLTNSGLQELNRTANTAQVKAETALAKGIEAQKQGTVVQALSYYIQANNYNTGLAEATSRMNILNANITSGNIGQDTRNDITWRKDWVARLQETEIFFSNSIKAPQPFYIVYSTDIEQGKIDYQKETTDLSIWMGFYPDYAWAEQINEVVNAVKKGLQATGRAKVWELDWPAKSINSPSPFVNQTKNLTSTVIVEIINSEGKSIGRQTVKSPYGFEIKDTAITPLWQWEGNVSFSAVNANLITDRLEIRITTIDGITAENAAKQKNINIMPLKEWELLLKTFPSIKQNIEKIQQIERARASFERGKKNYKSGDYNSAITDFTEAISLNPNTDYYFQRGQAYNEIKQYDRAISDYSTVIQLEPNNSTMYVYRGDVYFWQESYDKAITDYTEAIKIAPKEIINLTSKLVIAYVNRGDVYFWQKSYDKAITDYTEAIRLDPNFALAYNNRGNVYFGKGDYNMAIVEYTQAIKINPNYADAYLYRGFAYSNKGDYDRAMADYTQVIKINPNNAQAYNNRGAIYQFIKGDKQRAIADYETAIRLDSNLTDARNSLKNLRGY